jgi:hypothetical protein
MFHKQVADNGTSRHGVLYNILGERAPVLRFETMFMNPQSIWASPLLVDE